MAKQTRIPQNVDRWWGQVERCARMLGRFGPDELCAEGLSQRQCAILRILVSKPGARLSDLATSSGITPSAMTRVLERLEFRGLVERVRGKHPDRRASTVRITQEGRRIRELLDRLMRYRTAQIVAALPAGQRLPVLHALEALNAAMDATNFCGLNAPVGTLDSGRQGKSERRSYDALGE